MWVIIGIIVFILILIIIIVAVANSSNGSGEYRNHNNSSNNYEPRILPKQDEWDKYQQERFGQLGEEYVADMLQDIVDDNKAYLFNDYTFLDENGYSTNIDHKYFYLIVNNDYGFTLQPALILAAINYKDSDEVVEQKIQLVSKYITKVLSWRVWNHWMISQSSLEAPVYDLCKKIRDKSVDEIKAILKKAPIELPALNNSPSGLDFKSYEEFKKKSINERAELYKAILIWNWNNEE